MKTTDSLLKALEGAVRDSTLDLDSVPWRSRPSFEMAKRDGVESIPRLRAEYAERIFANPLYFFPVGAADRAAQFAAIAAKEGGTFTADAIAAYAVLAQKVEPTLGYRREFSVQQLIVLNDAIDDLTRTSPQPVSFALPTDTLKALDTVPTFEALVGFIRNAIEASYGAGYAKLYVTSVLLDAAIAHQFSGKVLAAVVLNVDEKLTASLMGGAARGSVVDVDAAEVIDKSFAINVFKDASTRAKKAR